MPGFSFYLITNDICVCKKIHSVGIERVIVDLETLGKSERQKNVNSWITDHKMEDINKIKKSVPNLHVMTRINPMNYSSEDEINRVIDNGANSIMLPMFRSLKELEDVFDIVNSRVPVVPLYETTDAIKLLEKSLSLFPIKTIHIGLNDLNIDLGYEFMFQSISIGYLDSVCEKLREKEIKFGIGGVARLFEGLVPPNVLLGEHVRLGSTAAILSRTFCRGKDMLSNELAISNEIDKLNRAIENFNCSDVSELENNRNIFKILVNNIVKRQKEIEN